MGCDLLDSITASSPEALERKAVSMDFKEFAPSPLFLMFLLPSQRSQSFRRTSIVIFREPLQNWRNLFSLQPLLSVPWSCTPLSHTALVSTPFLEGQSPHVQRSPYDDLSSPSQWFLSWLSDMTLSHRSHWLRSCVGWHPTKSRFLRANFPPDLSTSISSELTLSFQRPLFTGNRAHRWEVRVLQCTIIIMLFK